MEYLSNDILIVHLFWDSVKFAENTSIACLFFTVGALICHSNGTDAT